MNLKSLILVGGMTVMPIALAENDPYLWLEEVDDEKALDWVRAENASPG